MRWTSMELAALATRAVPGLSPTGVADAPDDARDFMSAVVIDGSGNRWRVRGPQHHRAAVRLETEVQVLRGFSTAIRAELPFRVPSVAGATRVDDMRVFVYNHLPGEPVELAELIAAEANLVSELGRTVAAIHDLSESVVDHAELPRYSAERIRQRRLNELDAAASTGQVPPLLLRRWEHAMEDKALWEFTPAVVHGDMHEDSLLLEGQRVVAVTGWTDLHVGDPADDLAWLIAAPDQDFSHKVLAAYREHRSAATDEHILRRAALSAEFALAQWLVRGTTSENQQMVEEAVSLLGQLASDIETYGGRPIALTPQQDGQTTPPADTQDSKPVRRAGAAATIAGTGYQIPDDDDAAEPSVVTDADVAREAADEQGTEQPTEAVELPEDFADDLPEYVDDAQEFEDPAASSSSLPIQPNRDAERRAKQRNFFPASAASAASGRSASSPASAASAPSGGSAQSNSSAQSSSSAPSAPSPEGTASASSSAVYERHPGLRPPRG